MNKRTKKNLIKLAMLEVEKGIKKGNPPFAAILTDKKGNIIETAYNTTNSDKDITAHAEINLIRKVEKKLKTRSFADYCLFSNAESCSMCMSAAIKTGITVYYFGTPCEKTMDPYITVFDLAKVSKNKLSIETGILKDECIKQISQARNKLLN